MIDDPYLLLYLSSFLRVRDFLNLSRTSHLFTDDPLITDEIKKRIHNDTFVQIDTKYTVSKIYHSNSATCLVFPINSVIDFTSERMTLAIHTPNWIVSWTGVLFNDDTTDLKNTCIIVHVANTSYAYFAFHDDSCVIHLDEIHIRISPRKLVQERRQKFISSALFVVCILYAALGSNELVIRIELFVLAFLLVYFVSRESSSLLLLRIE